MATMDQPSLSIEVIEGLKAKGMSQSEIARAFEVTRQAVSFHVVNNPGKASKTPRQEYLQHFPWKVPVSMTQAKPYRNLRDHAEYWATSGEGMSDEKLSRLRGFYKKLRKHDLVVEFDPDIPPSRGISSGGFAYRPRVPEDGALIIRVNQHTELTETGRYMWTFPTVEP